MKNIAPMLLLAFAAPVAAQSQGGGMPGYGQPQGGARPDPAQMFIQQLDANKDGKVSLEEFLAPGTRQFGQIDKDGDGYITPDEAKAFQEEMQKRMEQMRQQMQQQRGQQQGQPGGYGQYPQR